MQLEHFDRPRATKPIPVDVDGEPKGVLLIQDDGFRFLAVKLDAFAVDGQVFETQADAENAVRIAVRQ